MLLHSVLNGSGGTVAVGSAGPSVPMGSELQGSNVAARFQHCPAVHWQMGTPVHLGISLRSKPVPRGHGTWFQARPMCRSGLEAAVGGAWAGTGAAGWE